MKNGIMLAVILVSSFIGQKSYAQEVFTGPAISVDKETHDYGHMQYEANGTCEFTITNIGTEPLIITDARASCGCTVPEYPKEPIAPGESAVIVVTYNTTLVGNFAKNVTITSNAVNTRIKIINIKGSVAPKPEGTAPVSPTNPSAPAAPTNSRSANGSATLTTPKR